MAAMPARIVPMLINPANINGAAKLDMRPRRLFLRMMTPRAPLVIVEGRHKLLAPRLLPPSPLTARSAPLARIKRADLEGQHAGKFVVRFDGGGGQTATLCRRRHQPRRPPLARIRPGRPAPTIGPGTAAAVPINREVLSVMKLEKGN